MAVAPGSRFGPYEVQSLLGAGGMGEVYRARDTRLGRTVAVKVLPERLSSSPEIRRRFEREAKTISSLSHPHICALYDVGNQDGVEYLVMEYLEGETLAGRLRKGPLPLEQVIRCGAEIANALDRAHRQGIVHRDLKPGNVMLTKSGVKLLDFGLAKAIAPASAAPGVTTSPADEPLTEEGAVLGTFQYMAPEQLEGREADARSDVFALGSVIFEMATGRTAFSGTSRASLISSILTAVPPAVSALAPLSPPALDRIVKTCLAKDPEERWQSARDVALQLLGVSEERGTPLAARRGPWRSLLLGAGLLAVAGSTALLVLPRGASPEADPVSFSVTPGGRPWFRRTVQTEFSLSPDGRNLAFIGQNAAGQVVLWVRPLRALSARPLEGTEGAEGPFWSPDNRWIGFSAQRKLKKVEIAGGSPLTICELEGNNHSGSWGSSGEILFAQLIDSDVHRVSSGGGSPVSVLRADRERQEWSVCWPSFLPDSRHFLYVGRSPGAKHTYLRLGDLETGKSSALFSDCSRAEYAPGIGGPASSAGLLLCAREGNLLAVPFDAGGLRVTGEARPVVRDVLQHPFIGNASFSVSRRGLLAYRSADGPARLEWLDRQGRSIGAEANPAIYRSVRLSPDGRKFTASIGELPARTSSLWVADVASGNSRRLTLGDGDDFLPVWSPDGRKVAFSRGSTGSSPRMYEVSLDGGEPRELTASGLPEPGAPRGPQFLQDWSSDGRLICFLEWSLEKKSDIWILDLEERKKTAFIATPFDEIEPQFSPDGRWLAYSSDESGQFELYLAPLPGPGEKLRVSSSGGLRPRWRRDGKELFYLSGDNRMTMAAIGQDSGPVVGRTESLFSLDPAGWRDYDVAADGMKFLLISADDRRSSSISLITNWRALLEAP